MIDNSLHILLFKIAGTCLVLLIAIGIDNLFFDIFSVSGGTAYNITVFGFLTFFAGIILAIWSNFDN